MWKMHSTWQRIWDINIYKSALQIIHEYLYIYIYIYGSTLQYDLIEGNFSN